MEPKPGVSFLYFPDNVPRMHGGTFFGSPTYTLSTELRDQIPRIQDTSPHMQAFLSTGGLRYLPPSIRVTLRDVIGSRQETPTDGSIRDYVLGVNRKIGAFPGCIFANHNLDLAVDVLARLGMDVSADAYALEAYPGHHLYAVSISEPGKMNNHLPYLRKISG